MIIIIIKKSKCKFCGMAGAIFMCNFRLTALQLRTFNLLNVAGFGEKQFSAWLSFSTVLTPLYSKLILIGILFFCQS